MAAPAADPGAVPAPPDWRAGHAAAVRYRRFEWATGPRAAPHPAFPGARMRPAGFWLLTDLQQYGVPRRERKRCGARALSLRWREAGQRGARRAQGAAPLLPLPAAAPGADRRRRRRTRAASPRPRLGAPCPAGRRVAAVPVRPSVPPGRRAARRACGESSPLAERRAAPSPPPRFKPGDWILQQPDDPGARTGEGRCARTARCGRRCGQPGARGATAAH
jgi:hypothetical protein